MPSYSFVLNGKPVTVEAPADMPLLWVLRDLLHVTGPKYGCGVGVCRACTSHLDGAEIQPCVVPVADCVGRGVTTIEGLAYCDTCTPCNRRGSTAMSLSAASVSRDRSWPPRPCSKKTPRPTDDDIDRIENVCRCGTYSRIREAIKKAADADEHVTRPGRSHP